MKLGSVVTTWMIVGFAVLALNALATTEIQKPAFSLSLPDGWVEIPQNVLLKMHAELERQAPNANIPKYDFGFQRQPSTNWMEYPYVLVQIRDTGRVPEYQLRSLPKLDLNEKLKERTENLQSILTNAAVGKMQYDEAAHVAWIVSQSDVAGTGRIFGISGVIPTEKGVILVHAYCHESDFQSYLPVFRQIITSTTVPADRLYRLRWLDSVPILSGIDWRQVLVAGIVGGLIALVGAFIRRRKGA